MIRRLGATYATRPPSAGTITIAAWRSWPDARGARELLQGYLDGSRGTRTCSAAGSPMGEPQDRLCLRRPGGNWKSYGASPDPISPRLHIDPGKASTTRSSASWVGAVGHPAIFTGGCRCNGGSNGHMPDFGLATGVDRLVAQCRRDAGCRRGTWRGRIGRRCAAGILTAEEAPPLGRQRRARGTVRRRRPNPAPPCCRSFRPSMARALRSRSGPGPLAIVSPPSAERGLTAGKALGAADGGLLPGTGRCRAPHRLPWTPWSLRSRPWALLCCRRRFDLGAAGAGRTAGVFGCRPIPGKNSVCGRAERNGLRPVPAARNASRIAASVARGPN